MRTLLLFLLLVVSKAAYCAIDTLEIDSQIKDVTVFFNGAQITRKSKIKVPKSKHVNCQIH